MSALASRYVPVPDGAGGIRHELRLVSSIAEPRRRKRSVVPDPIRADGNASAQQLRQLIERAERIQEEIAEGQADLDDVMAEAKATGFDKKTIRKIMAMRKKEKHILQEEDALLEAYRAALGLS